MLEKWSVRRSTRLNSYRIFSTRKDSCVSLSNGREHDFYIIESPDWVNVIAVTEDGRFVMIRQFRHGTKCITLEIPGGMVDSGESPLDAARRELLEETGYSAEKWDRLGVVSPNPAIMNNSCHIFLASDARKVSEPDFDGTEDIETDLLDPGEVKGMITSGEIDHSLVLSAFSLYFLEY